MEEDIIKIKINPEVINFGVFSFMNKSQYMKTAITLAKKGGDKVYPNPMVGCVIVKDNKIIGKGWHDYFGGNHAEINALSEAGEKANGADMYVTLEPCNSYGKRPPCTEAIIKAGIKKVFFAVKDPNVSRSRERLESNGIEVFSGLMEKEAKKLIKVYLDHLKKKCRVTIKAAMTLDGKLATGTYDSKWITSEQSRRFAHKLRTKYDAILVGTNTALKDNPALDSHSQGKNPVRVVVDAKLKLSGKYNLLNGKIPTVVIYDKKVKKIPPVFKKEGIILAAVDIASAKKDFNIIIEKLNSMSLKTVLIEGGGAIISSAVFSKCVDDLYIFIAPKIIGGGNSVSVVGGRGVEKIADAVKVKNMRVKKIASDILITGKIK